MKKLFPILFAFMLVILTSCNSDEPEVNDGVGQLIVNLANNDSENPNMDFSNYHIALTREYGMGWTAPDFSEVTWPIDVKVGTYTIGVASPLVSETETTETYYFGEVKNVKIVKDKTTEITINVKLTEFQKSDL
ncbi:MAG: DUF4493 domain-containing protein [Bacteroidales bacterium]|nr:DUF4493 domain-containing protein [Bacteroidales bacterium]MBD5386783.1 DUF4493 domain-containing protein [bacterium]